MSFRNPKWIDLNPSAGDSFLGLTRRQAKWLGLSIIIFSIFLMMPPGLPPEPTDAVNIIMAKYIVNWLGIEPTTALLYTYTFIAWAIFALGLYIYPYSTTRLFNGYISKLKRFIKKSLKKPFFILIAILIFYYVFNIYKQILMSIL